MRWPGPTTPFFGHKHHHVLVLSWYAARTPEFCHRQFITPARLTKTLKRLLCCSNTIISFFKRSKMPMRLPFVFLLYAFRHQVPYFFLVMVRRTVHRSFAIVIYLVDALAARFDQDFDVSKVAFLATSDVQRFTVFNGPRWPRKWYFFRLLTSNSNVIKVCAVFCFHI